MASSDVPTTTQDIYEEKAMLLVEQLLDNGTVTMKDDVAVLHHVPSGARFESAVNLAHFHKGWEQRADAADVNQNC